MRNVRSLRAANAVPSTPMPVSGAPRSSVPHSVPSAPTISRPNAIALPPGRRKKSPREASHAGAGRSLVSPAPIRQRYRREGTPLGGCAAIATAPPARAAVNGALSVQPATGKVSAESVPSGASQRALASASPYTCHTISVAPVVLMEPPVMGLPADAGKAPTVLVARSVPSAPVAGGGARGIALETVHARPDARADRDVGGAGCGGRDHPGTGAGVRNRDPFTRRDGRVAGTGFRRTCVGRRPWRKRRADVDQRISGRATLRTSEDQGRCGQPGCVAHVPAN